MKLELKLSLIILLFSLVYLIPQVFPGLHVGDSGELIASANVLGNAHPPGYPLFSILNKLFLIFPSENPAHRINLAQAVFGAMAAAAMFFLTLSFFGVKDNHALAGAVFASLLLLSGKPFIEQATVAEVFMINLVVCIGILTAVVNRKYMAAGFIAGVGLGNQHTLVLIFPAVAYFMFRKDRKFLYFLLCMALGLSVYLYLPVRASADPPLNWGDPSTFINFFNIFLRRQYGTLSLHGSSSAFTLSKALAITGYFFSRLIQLLTLPGFLMAVAGTYMLIKKNRDLGISISLVFVFTGPVFFLMTNMNLDAAGKSILERFFLLPYAASVLGITGIFHLKKIRYAACILPVYLMAANFTPASDKPAPLYQYLLDITDTLSPDEPLYITRGGVGDDLVFGFTYLKWAENKVPDLKIYSEYGSIFEKPVPVKGRAAVASFSPYYRGYKLYQAGLLFKNYSQEMTFESYRGVGSYKNLTYRQRNIAVIYPFFKGLYHFMKKETGTGEKEFSIAAQMGGDIPWLLNNIGNAYKDIGMDEKAYEFYKQAVKLDSHMAESYNNMGNIHFNQGEMEEAVEFYTRAIDIEPDTVRHYNLGLALLSMRDYPAAKENFSKALRFDPGYVNAYNDLGLACFRSGEIEEASKVYEKGLELDPGNLNLIYNMALALQQIKPAHAKGYWKEFLRLSSPDDPDRRRALRYLKNEN